MGKILFVLLTLWVVVCACSKNEGGNENPSEDAPEKPIEEDHVGPEAVEKTNPMKLYMHYMPWFETPETSANGSWGIHWTMGNKNPDKEIENGKKEIASHYYPLIGPYASGDKDVIEYHLLLMKYAGVDGLIIDWYGSSDVNDFGTNRKNSEAVIDLLDNVGLEFALAYEDWTVLPVVEKGFEEDEVQAAIADFKYMEATYFKSRQYTRINGVPLLTVFGPRTIQNGKDWENVLNTLSDKPVFLSIWYESGELGTTASGEFSWVYEDNSHIENFYAHQLNRLELAIGSAYPGFKDYYVEGGWEGSHTGWIIDHEGGNTFDETLQMANDAKIDYLQLVTWNDFGEGTMIEPTIEFEYTYLEKLQEFAGISYSKLELEYITHLYNLRKNLADNKDAQQILDQAFDYFIKLRPESARVIIDDLMR